MRIREGGQISLAIGRTSWIGLRGPYSEEERKRLIESFVIGQRASLRNLRRSVLRLPPEQLLRPALGTEWEHAAEGIATLAAQAAEHGQSRPTLDLCASVQGGISSLKTGAPDRPRT